MALMDQNLVFSSAQAVTASADSTYTYDLEIGNTVTTSGTFTPAPSAIIGNATYFGEDLGLGRGVGTPSVVGFTGGTISSGSAMTVEFLGAPVNATAYASGNVSDLTFTVYIATGAIPSASITTGIRLFEFDWPRRQISINMPRFVKLNYGMASTSFVGLTITAYAYLGGTSAQTSLGQYAANY